MDKFLTLWLEAPLQSWGCDSRFDARHTLDYPTKSGLYGLLLAASGDLGAQEELLGALADAPQCYYFQGIQKFLHWNVEFLHDPGLHKVPFCSRI